MERKIMFKPKAIYFEKEIENYELGKQLLEKYKETPKMSKGTPFFDKFFWKILIFLKLCSNMFI